LGSAECGVREQPQGSLDDDLGLRSRDEDPWIYLEFQGPKLPDASNVLQRFMPCPAAQQLTKGVY
jgi:hypothetical protein